MICVLRLTALHGTPLDDAGVRRNVEAAARAIGEREGIEVRGLEVAPDSIAITIDADRLTGLGFAAELRRVTNQWYEQKYRDGPLWGTPKPGDDGTGGEWEREDRDGDD